MENFIDIFEFSNKFNNFFKMQGCVIGSTDQNFCVFCISYTERIGSDAWEVECIHAGTVHVFHLHVVSANVTALKVICVCVSRTRRLLRPLFCCCCCSMSSMAEAGGEAARMFRTTLMLSSGSGGRFNRSLVLTFISCNSSKPPRVNWGAQTHRNQWTEHYRHINRSVID